MLTCRGRSYTEKHAIIDTSSLKIQKDGCWILRLAAWILKILRPFLQYGSGIDGGGNSGYSGGNNNKGVLVEADLGTINFLIAGAGKVASFDSSASIVASRI